MPRRAIAAFSLCVVLGLLVQAGSMIYLAYDGVEQEWLFLSIAGLVALAGVAAMFAQWQLGIDARWRERTFLAVELLGGVLVTAQLFALFV